MKTRRGASVVGMVMVALTWCLLTSPELFAQTYDRGENSFWSIYFENDTFYDTDQSYTSGVSIVWIKSVNEAGEHWWLPEDLLRRTFTPSRKEDARLAWEWSGGWVVGQTFYTPQDISIAEIVEDDRPYGGWLYLGKQLHLSRPDVGYRGEVKATQHTFEVDVGVTGNWSFAEQVQTFIHAGIAKGATEPEGWDHQIGNGPGVVLRYTGRQRSLEWIARNRRVVDLVPEWTLVAGNIFTYGGAGLTLRAGLNLGNDFGPSRIQPVAPMMTRRRWELYGFASVGTRAVAHNVFLDGRWFGADPHRVSKEHVVADAEVGAFARFKRVAASFRWVRRTPEFQERKIYQEYGALNLTILY